MTFTLELLHFSDQEGASGAVVDAPNLSAVLNALRAEDLGDDGVEDNSITLSSGDAFIPGLFFEASEAVFGSVGIADIQIQNELGIEAIALGNHEFDYGTAVLAGLIDGSTVGDFTSDFFIGTDLEGLDFTGTDMPYLSANLDFSTDANLAGLEIAGGLAPQGNVVTSSTVLEEGGELIGVVGAVTPTLASISSPGDLGILPEWAGSIPTDAELDALAAVIQTEVDALLAANPDMNKVILLSHMQQISIEQELATRLSNVDIIVAGGSNTLLVDENDRVRDGDSAQGEYPQFYSDADGNTVALVNTDGSYEYVGRLVIDFDDDGHVLADSYDADVSGAYATDDQGVADLDAEDLVDAEIQAIADAIEAQIVSTESNVFGVSDVYLNGNRSGTFEADDPDGVRTQETNLGNLTADANLAMAQDYDDTVVISIKNGGGIRASIGQEIVPAGGTEAERTANEEVTDSEGNVIKEEGGISQNDIQTTLAFNNGLTLLTVTKQELIDVLEHGVSALPEVAGSFPQISGVSFSFDETQPVGDRIQSAAIVDADGNVVQELVRDGELVGDASDTFRIVTLSFMADGGDDYPFPTGDAVERVDLFAADEADETFTGDATFAADGTEQDALAEYLLENYGDADSAFDIADTGVEDDARIQNLTYRDDDVLDPLWETQTGGIGSDVLLGTDLGNDRLFGENGEDVLLGRGDDDFLSGGKHDDILRGGNDDDILQGGMGNDQLFGGHDDDILNGGNGNDMLFGNAGEDDLRGGNGDDEVNGGGGDDNLFGGEGSDNFVFYAASDMDNVRDFDADEDSLTFIGQTADDLDIIQVGNTVEIAYASELVVLHNVAATDLVEGDNLLFV